MFYFYSCCYRDGGVDYLNGLSVIRRSFSFLDGIFVVWVRYYGNLLFRLYNFGTFFVFFNLGFVCGYI